MQFLSNILTCLTSTANRTPGANRGYITTLIYKLLVFFALQETQIVLFCSLQSRFARLSVSQTEASRFVNQ